MTRPEWLPAPPEGWGEWGRDYYGAWRTERSDGAWICLSVTSLGHTVTAGYGAGHQREGEMHRCVGQNVATLRRCCAALGLSEWVPQAPDAPGWWWRREWQTEDQRPALVEDLGPASGGGLWTRSGRYDVRVSTLTGWLGPCLPPEAP